MTTNWKIALGRVLPQTLEQFLLSTAAGAEIRRLPGSSEEDLLSSAADVDALIVGTREALTARVLVGLPKCRIIARYGMGVDNVDIDAATRQGILVTSVPDASVEEVSDHAIALLVACARRIPALNLIVKTGQWSRHGAPVVAQARSGMHRLTGRVLGVVGFGRIGQASWKKAQAFGLVGLVYDPFVPKHVIQSTGAEPVSWEDLLARSDFITLHTPLSRETRNFINGPALARMKPNSFLINTARGGLVDESALIEALKSGRIAGAALDVTTMEPLPIDSPLLALDQVLLTAHSAYFSEEANSETGHRVVASVLAALEGKVPEGLVNPLALQKSKAALEQSQGPHFE
jgi:D-3-phosphoglycerate dehydrogenase